MSLFALIKLIRANLMTLFVIPVVMGVLVTILTQDSPQTYTTKAKVYTGIASGYSIESQQNASFNYFAINNAFDNLIDLIKSRSTIEETALRLYALHLTQDEARLPIMTMASFDEMKSITPPEISGLVDKTSVDHTFQNLQEYMNKDHTNFLYKMINAGKTHYSLETISALKVRRVANSDMIEISFDSDDPAVCYQTIKILMKTFIRDNATMKENQTDAVVNYFESQLETSHRKLQVAEKKLLNFNEKNRIINYYEQTKHVASEKEKFELERQTVMLNYAASKSVINNLEKNLGTKNIIQLQNENIIKIRSRLTELNKEIALDGLMLIPADSTKSSPHDDLDLLKEEADQLKEQLRATVDTLHFYQTTKEGLQVEEVITQWLSNVIAFEEANAKLIALDQRRNELDETIKHFAPLGANLKKIEREIDVDEREYLSLLHSLGLAKLKQQNIELSSNIKVVDPPLLPIEPLPSKRKFLIIAAVMVGFIMTFGMIILLRFFDTTLQHTSNSERLTRLKCIGNYPAMGKKKKADPYFDELIQGSNSSIVNQILERCKDGKHKEPFTLAFISNYLNEGKTTLLESVKSKLQASGLTVETANMNDNPPESKLKKGVNMRLIEFPSLINKVLPPGIGDGFDLLIYVIRANRGWSKADENMVETVKKVAHQDPVFILNSVKLDNMGDFTGQIPKKRSRLRKFIKRITMFRFFETFEVKS